MSKLDSSVTRCEAPANAASVPVALVLPSFGFFVQFLRATDPPIQTHARQHTQLDFSHVQPTAVARRVVDFQTPGQLMGLVCWKSFVQRSDTVGVQIVAHQFHLSSLWVVLFQQAAYFLGPIDAGPAVPTTDATPATQRVEKHKHSLHPTTLIVIILTRRLAGSQRQRRLLVAYQLLAGFIHTNQGLFRRVFGGIDIEDVFHLSNEPRPVPFRNAPTLLAPRLQFIFFSARRTLSAQTEVTILRAFNSLAKSFRVQRVRPAGAWLQHMAIRWASTRPSIFAGTGGVSRTLRSSTGFSPSKTNRLRIRSTVFTCMPRVWAIWSRVNGPSGRFRSLSSSTCALRTLRTGACPHRVICCNRSRSSASSRTGYKLGVEVIRMPPCIRVYGRQPP